MELKQKDSDRILKEVANLEQDLKVKAIRAGLTKVSAPITKTMKADVPVKSGALKQSIGRSRLSESAKGRLGIKAGKEAVIIGPNKKVRGRSQSRKAMLVDAGTKPHKIKAKGEVLLLAGINAFSKLVNHPGIKATHFIGNALTKNRSGIQGRFYQGLAGYLRRNA